jgi:hypothetical protein
MDGDDQSSESGSEGELPLIDLITDLASSRPDSISEDEREELVENATDLLSEDADNRRALADHGGAYGKRNRRLLPIAHSLRGRYQKYFHV